MLRNEDFEEFGSSQVKNFKGSGEVIVGVSN